MKTKFLLEMSTRRPSSRCFSRLRFGQTCAAHWESPNSVLQTFIKMEVFEIFTVKKHPLKSAQSGGVSEGVLYLHFIYKNMKPW